MNTFSKLGNYILIEPISYVVKTLCTNYVTTTKISFIQLSYFRISGFDVVSEYDSTIYFARISSIG